MGNLRHLWFHPRSHAALTWNPEDPRDASSAVADAASTPGIYPLFGADEDDTGERASEEGSAAAVRPFGPLLGTPAQEDAAHAFTFAELGISYNFLPPRRFGDPSLFLDFRTTRRWVRSRIRNMVEARGGGGGGGDGDPVSVLNAFAYTCGGVTSTSLSHPSHPPASRRSAARDDDIQTDVVAVFDNRGPFS